MKEFIAFVHPEPDPEAVMRELAKPIVDDGSVKLLKGEIGRVDSDFKFVGMNPENFELQRTDIDQPKLLDGECATRSWPMPPVKVWEPRPEADRKEWPELPVWGDWGASIVGEEEFATEARRITAEREALVRAPQPDPAEEKNSVAAMLTRVMRWVQQ